MGGSTKKRKVSATSNRDMEMHPTLKRGSFELIIGAKVEAMDYLGNWYGAKIIQVKLDKKEILIHFDGWNSRYDTWLPHDSDKLREVKCAKPKLQEWRVGARVIAKWGPANTLYPAIVSRIVSDCSVEVKFYDGIKKTVKNNSLQTDTEKLYRQYDGSAIKSIFSPGAAGKKTSTVDFVEPETASGMRVKRRLTEPPAMADYITDIHKKRRSKKGSDRSTSEDDRGSMFGTNLPSSGETSSTCTTPSFQNIQPSNDSPHELKMENDKICKFTTSMKQSQSQPVISQSSSPSSSCFMEDLETKRFDSFQISNSILESNAGTSPMKLSEKNEGKVGTQNTMCDVKSGIYVIDKDSSEISNTESSLQHSIPKIKLKICKDSPVFKISDTDKYSHSTPQSTSKMNKSQSNVEIVKSNFSSYMIFPVLSSPEDSDDNCATPEPKWKIESLNSSIPQYDIVKPGTTDMLNNSTIYGQFSDTSLEVNASSEKTSIPFDNKVNSDDHTSEVIENIRSDMPLRKCKQETMDKSLQGSVITDDENTKIRNNSGKRSYRKHGLEMSLLETQKESSKISRNSQELNQRKSDRISTATAKSATNKTIKEESDMDASETSKRLIYTTRHSNDKSASLSDNLSTCSKVRKLSGEANVNTSTENKSRPPRNVNIDSEDEPLIRIKLSKHADLKPREEKPNKLVSKSKKDSKGRETIVDRIDKRATYEVDITPRCPSENLYAADDETAIKSPDGVQQNTPPSLAEVESIPKETSQNISVCGTKEKRRSEVGGKNTTSDHSKQQRRSVVCDDKDAFSCPGVGTSETSENTDKQVLDEMLSTSKIDSAEASLQLRKSSRIKQKLPESDVKSNTADDKDCDKSQGTLRRKQDLEDENSSNIKVKMHTDFKDVTSYNTEQSLSETSTLPIRRSSRVKTPKSNEEADSIEVKIEKSSDVQSSSEDLLCNPASVGKRNIIGRTKEDKKVRDISNKKDKEPKLLPDNDIRSRRNAKVNKSGTVHQNMSIEKSLEKVENKNVEKSITSNLKRLRTRKDSSQVSESNDADIDGTKKHVLKNSFHRELKKPSEELFQDIMDDLSTKSCEKLTVGVSEESNQRANSSDFDTISKKPDIELPVTEFSKIHKETRLDNGLENFQCASKTTECSTIVVREVDIEDMKENMDTQQTVANNSSNDESTGTKKTSIQKERVAKVDGETISVKIVNVHEKYPGQHLDESISIKENRHTNEKVSADISSSDEWTSITTQNGEGGSLQNSEFSIRDQQNNSSKIELRDSTVDRCTSVTKEIEPYIETCYNEEPGLLQGNENNITSDAVLKGDNSNVQMKEYSEVSALSHEHPYNYLLDDSRESMITSTIIKSEGSDDISVEKSALDKQYVRTVIIKPDSTLVISMETMQDLNDGYANSSTDAYIDDSNKNRVDSKVNVVNDEEMLCFDSHTKPPEKLHFDSGLVDSKELKSSSMNASDEQELTKEDATSTNDATLMTQNENNQTLNVDLPVNAVSELIEEVPIVNIFTQCVPDLNSGRPIRKNKLKKPARYSSEISNNTHTKTKKEARETAIGKSGISTDGTSSTPMLSKSRKDSKEKKLTSSVVKGDALNVKCESDDKVLTHQEDASILKLKLIHQKEDHGNSKNEENIPLKSKKFSKNVAGTKSREKFVLKLKGDSKEKEAKVNVKTGSMGTRRTENKKIPIKGSKIIKPKISLQTVTGRKHGIVNQKFEEKYELFKKRWKEEKEKRRMLQQQEEEVHTDRKNVTERDTETDKTPTKNMTIENNEEKKELVFGTVLNNDTKNSKVSQSIKKRPVASDLAFKNAEDLTMKAFDVKPVKVKPSIVEEKKIEVSTASVSEEIKKVNTIKSIPKIKCRIKHTPNSRFGKASPTRSTLNKLKKKGKVMKTKENSTKNNIEICGKEKNIKTTPQNIPSSRENISDCSMSDSAERTHASMESVLPGGSNTDISENEKLSMNESAEKNTSNKKNKLYVSKKGRPFNKKRKRNDPDYMPDPEDVHRLVTDRTPTDTISFASMIEEERPSQKKRPDVARPSTTVKTTISNVHNSPAKIPDVSPQKVIQPYFTMAARHTTLPSSTQIVASRIQKRVHQQKIISMLNSPEHYSNYKSCFDFSSPHHIPTVNDGGEKVITERNSICFGDGYDDNILVVQPSDHSIGEKEKSEVIPLLDDGKCNEINLMDITLGKLNKEENPTVKLPLKKRKSLDFITRRLTYKQRIDSIAGRLKTSQELDLYKSKSQASRTELTNFSCTTNNQGISYSYPNVFIPPHCVNTAGILPPNVMTTQKSPLRTIIPVSPLQPNQRMLLNVHMPGQMTMPVGVVMSPMMAQTPPQPLEQLLRLQGRTPLIHTQVMQRSPFETVGPHVIPIQFQNPTLVPHLANTNLLPHTLKNIKPKKVTSLKDYKDSKPTVEEVKTMESKDTTPVKVLPTLPEVWPISSAVACTTIADLYSKSCDVIYSKPSDAVVCSTLSDVIYSTSAVVCSTPSDAIYTTTSSIICSTSSDVIYSATSAGVCSTPSDAIYATTSAVCSTVAVSLTPSIPEEEESKEMNDKDSKDDSIKKTDGMKKKKQQKVVPEKENFHKLQKEKKIKSPKGMTSGVKKMKIDAEKNAVPQLFPVKDVPAEPPLNEYKCNIVDCGKTFRKSHLLEYHIKYFHTAKPFQKKSRASTVVSSIESSTVVPATDSATLKVVTMTAVTIMPSTVQEIKPLITTPSEIHIPEQQSDSAISESESESEEELQSVDDCVKCVCEDECELGFMIQCEQCFTWQHGECVGYSQPKAVPLFYLCHVCSNPKGLRKSSQYVNDYTWYRHGLLPPIRQDAPDDKLDEIDQGRHVDADNEELLSSIMLTTHAMMTDLYNVRDVLQGIRNKFILLKDPENPELLEWKGDNDESALLTIKQKIKESEESKNQISTDDNIIKTEDTKNKTKITEKFDKDFNDRLVSISNKNTEYKHLTNKICAEKMYKVNIKDDEYSKTIDSVSSTKDEINNMTTNPCIKTTGGDIERDVNIVVRNIVNMIASLDTTNVVEITSQISGLSEYKNLPSGKNLEVLKSAMMDTGSRDVIDDIVKYPCDQNSYTEYARINFDTNRSNTVESNKFKHDSKISSKDETNQNMSTTCTNLDVNRILDIRKCDVNTDLLKSRTGNKYNAAIERLRLERNFKLKQEKYKGPSTCKEIITVEDDVKNMIENLVENVCNVVDTIDNTTNSEDIKHNILCKHEPTRNNNSKIKQPGTMQYMKKQVLLKEHSNVSVSLENKKAEESDKDFTDIANISEDSIPYMETDEESDDPGKDELISNIDSDTKPTSYETEEMFFRSFSCHGIDNILKDDEDWQKSSRESLIARYNVLVEIEKVEDQINDRLEDMHSKLDELEAEYDSIDKSKAILEDFKKKFKLPDMKMLMARLNKVKWQSIIKSSNEHALM